MRPLTLSARSGLDAVLAAMLGNALGQVLANASVLAAPADADALAAHAADAADVAAAAAVAASLADHPVPDPELLHQLRVGLRRLRTVLTLFGGLLPPAVLKRGKVFHATPRIIEMVNAALYLRRPLLVTGAPGSGK